MPLAAVVFLVIFSLKAFITIPPAPLLYILAGIIFPFPVAVIVIYVCLASEMTLGYLFGKKLGERRVKAFIENKKLAARFLNRDRGNTMAFCFITRVLPLPKDPISMFYGAVVMPFPRFLVASLLGLTPVMIPFTLAGDSIDNPLSAEFIIPFAVCLVFSVALLIVYRVKTRKAT